MLARLGLTLWVLMLLTACAGQQTLSEEERQLQNRASEAVSSILFDFDLDTQASYNIHRDGFVVIEFSPEVAEQTYTEAVQALRRSPEIPGVRAEQGGREVCPLAFPG